MLIFFQQYLQHTYVCIHIRWDIREALSLSYIPSYVHVRPGYREKLADLQGTHKPHLRFYNRFLRLQTPRNKNWHAHYTLRARSMATNASISQG